MGKKGKVFNKKGSFSANEKDPPIGQPIEIPAEHPIAPTELAPKKRPPVPNIKPRDTQCHELNNVRVRVLKPDPVFIRDITDRLSRLDRAVQKLNTNVKPED